MVGEIKKITLPAFRALRDRVEPVDEPNIASTSGRGSIDQMVFLDGEEISANRADRMEEQVFRQNHNRLVPYQRGRSNYDKVVALLAAGSDAEVFAQPQNFKSLGVAIKLLGRDGGGYEQEVEGLKELQGAAAKLKPAAPVFAAAKKVATLIAM